MTYIGNIPPETGAAVAFIALDVVTGLIKAVKERNISSTKAREGIFKKFAFLAFIVFGYLADWTLTYIDIGIHVPIVLTVCSLICITEAISILENLGSINPEMVAIVRPFLAALQDKNEKETGDSHADNE